MEPFFTQNEKVELQLHVYSKAIINGLAIRMSVLNRENSVIGMASTAACINLVKGDNVLTTQLNIDCLSPGQYIIKLVVYEIGEFGANRNLDVIDEACAFEKIQTNENNKMVWNHKWWGYLMLPELLVIKNDGVN